MNDTRRWVTRAVIAVAVLTLIGLGLLWPRGEAPDLGIQPTDYVDATVTTIERTRCNAIEADALTDCSSIDAEITSGDDAGETAVFLVRDTEFDVPELDVGDRVVLLDVATSPPPFRYTFADLQRTTPLWGLLVLFVVAVVAVGRWQGLRALGGIVGSVVIIVVFLVPALLRDEPAVLIALVGSATIAFLAFYLAHGINPATTVALAGTLVSLVAITLLALVVTSTAQLSGLASEDAQALRVTASALDLRGLLVAGIVIGALGVLDDVTVTQVSAVAALRRANPSLGRVELYREAIRVGRDHVASTVNTLVLAYAGASLPLVLLFSQGSAPVGRIITSELVAVEIVRILVGSIGLILSVPITTALAAAVLTGDEEVHAGHDHGHVATPTGQVDAPTEGARQGPTRRDGGRDARGRRTGGRDAGSGEASDRDGGQDDGWDAFSPDEDPI